MMDGGGPLVLFLLCVLTFSETSGERGSQDDGGGKLYSLEGKVELLSVNDSSWMSHTRILVDGGKYQGFIRTDGQFTVNGLPNGAYIVEVFHPRYEFSPARMYIFRDGRKRASKLDLIRPNHVRQIKYPLLFREVKKSKFFQERASLKMEDLLQNPMVMMLLPLVILLMFPKMLNQSFFDPKVQDQFKRQLNTMTGGRGDMIGMGVPNEEKKEDDPSEGETTKENNEKKSTKKDKSKKEKPQIQMPFSFDLAEILTNYFHEEKTQKPSDNRSQQHKTTRKNRPKIRKRKH